jgi:SAM-dependent MidA family methyltransferase
MDLALYHPDFGYYARAARRSGRSGDFFTSVDVGPLFGELLERQIAEMADLLHAIPAQSTSPSSASSALPPLDVIEAGAGDGRLSVDILRAARASHPSLYRRLRLHLVESSAEARAKHREVLADAAERLASSSASLPESFEGVLLANELLDALPTHSVVMREEGLREIYVEASADGRLAAREGPLSTPLLAEYLARAGATLETGWRAEISLQAVQWVRDAARRLRRGFMILIDYGHEARELYSVGHSAGTLTTFAGHRMEGPGADSSVAPWLVAPGEHDITSHVDFTSIRAAAEAEGCRTLGLLDQTYFVMGLVAGSGGSLDSLASMNHLALKTLLMPGGLGSTMKVLLLGKDVGIPALRGCSYKVRVT